MFSIDVFSVGFEIYFVGFFLVFLGIVLVGKIRKDREICYELEEIEEIG